MRPVKLGGKGMGGARAHHSYIQRDGVTREGEPGTLYTADRDATDGKAFVERSTGDRHPLRFIVSAEDADQYPDLKTFVRRLLAQMGQDHGTKRSEEHTSELQSPMRLSYADLCFNNKTKQTKSNVKY